MPELPEVETIKLGLQKKIVGLKITKIQIYSPKSFIGNPNLAQGKKVLNIWRKAKILGMDLGSRSKIEYRISLLFHLKMTGQLIYESQVARIKSQGKGNLDSRLSTLDSRFVGGHPTLDMRDAMPNSHTRVIFSFSDGSHLYFNDQRRFGWVKIVNSSELIDNGLLINLGTEPLEKEFSWETLKQNLLKHPNMPVKVAIMDQTVISGIGNIYASEACFDAKINPILKVKDLSDQQFRRLHQGIVKSLKDGIKYGGASRAHFVDSEGHKGYFLSYAYVYGLDKHPCKKCKTEIKKIQLAGRGTYFCPNCQRQV